MRDGVERRPRRPRLLLAIATVVALGVTTASCGEQPTPRERLGKLRVIDFHKTARGDHSTEQIDSQFLFRCDGKAELHDLEKGTTQFAELSVDLFERLAAFLDEAELISMDPHSMGHTGAWSHRDFEVPHFTIRAEYQNGVVEVWTNSRDKRPMMQKVWQVLDDAQRVAQWRENP